MNRLPIMEMVKSVSLNEMADGVDDLLRFRWTRRSRPRVAGGEGGGG